jgi:hypothetical protein
METDSAADEAPQVQGPWRGVRCAARQEGRCQPRHVNYSLCPSLLGGHSITLSPLTLSHFAVPQSTPLSHLLAQSVQLPPTLSYPLLASIFLLVSLHQFSLTLPLFPEPRPTPLSPTTSPHSLSCSLPSTNSLSHSSPALSSPLSLLPLTFHTLPPFILAPPNAPPQGTTVSAALPPPPLLPNSSPVWFRT